MHKCGAWENWQVEIVVEKYPTLRSSEISPMIQRSTSAIDHFASRNGLSKEPSCEFEHRSKPRIGDGTWNFKGYRRKYKTGYVGIYKPDHPFSSKDGVIMEHRIVAEEMIGRFLRKDEVVHHKNGIRDDNRPENLVVMTFGKHVAMHNHERYMKRHAKD